MNNKIVSITGVFGASSAKIIGDIAEQKKTNLVVTSNLARGERLRENLSLFTNKEVILMPQEERSLMRYIARNKEHSVDRLKGINAISKNKEAIIIAPASALMKKVMPKSKFLVFGINLKVGQEIEIEKILEELVSLGYSRVDIISTQGEFALRGGILDIFSPDYDNPVRVDFFDIEIDSLKFFDIGSQRSIENIEEVEICPAREIIISKEEKEKAILKISKLYDKRIKELKNIEKDSSDKELDKGIEELTNRKELFLYQIEKEENLELVSDYMEYFFDHCNFLWDYLDDGNIIIDDPNRIDEHLEFRREELVRDLEFLIEKEEGIKDELNFIPKIEDYRKIYSSKDIYLLSQFFARVKGVEVYADHKNINLREVSRYHGKIEEFILQLNRYIEKNYRIVITYSREERKESLLKILSEKELLNKVELVFGTLTEGFELTDEKTVYISDNDIFSIKKATRRKKKKNKGEAFRTFAEIKKGDYVVHEDYGIGRFDKIETLRVEDSDRDYIKIQYFGKDVIYVPVEKLNTVQKYIGSDGVAPKLNKISGNEWKNAKLRARLAIEEMTTKLLDIYAKRKIEKGYSFQKDGEWQKEFENSFPYMETDDQLRCIEEIKEDMEKPIPMDRLLCGDVGFGKTEVAARALFKCLADGKQGAILVPTTLLAKQHYETLKARFEEFPFTVEVLSRFKSQGEQKKIIEKVKNGQIDLLIGTHRILSEDIKFKDLGLLVVDEEQRFGVLHKEKIKSLKANIDVLTLSATPIPRTLNMSMTGIKDMSLIEEAPEARFPVQTYVMEEDDFLIRDIITRELDREGQVFVVFNRVKGIYQVAERIEKLVPEAKIAVAHGQMKEDSLDNIMSDFIDGKFNILIATTIIESGIDIPNANSMIVLDSDRYGLSQLYQLRGRVGRSTRLSYAYFMYKKNKVMAEASEKRLRAIKEFTEFGSGFKIAMRDLEIRGAGNLLGSAQSGHLMNIGYELYCKMVDEAVRRSKGEVIEEETIDLQLDLLVSANIPNWYIKKEDVKLQMYKKIARVSLEEDKLDLIDEFLDRFGDIPKETLNLINLSLIRSYGIKVKVKKIFEEKDEVIVAFAEENKLNSYSLFKVNETFGREAFFHGGINPYIKLKVKANNKLDLILKLLEALNEDDSSGLGD